MLCHRNCGEESTYINYKGLHCCHKSASKCATVKNKIGSANSASLKGKKLTEEHRNNITNSLIKRNYVPSDETLEKIRQGNKKHWEMYPRDPWNKGLKGVQVAWNKGKKKQESLEIISRSDPVYSNFRKYRNRVAVRTRKIYEQFKEEINPLNLPLGKCGIAGAHQIDHVISVRIGFEKGLLVEEISAKENLQVIPWLDNVQKYDGKNLRNNNLRK